MRGFCLPTLILLCFWSAQLFGQRPGFSWDFGTEQGRIFKHTKKIAFPIPDHSYGIGLNFQYQTFGKAAWHQHQGYPLMGFGLQYYNFGDREILGNAVSFFPNLTLKILDKPRWMVHFRVGSGIAWIDRTYDRLNNPQNNSIGSQMNNTTCFRLTAGFAISPRWAVFAGGSFTHFSNGAFQMPNLGINIPAVSASLRYTPQPVEKEEYVRWEESKRPPGRFGVQGYFSLAYKETSFPGAAKWPVYAGSLAGIYRISKVQNLLIGGEYEYYQSVFVFSRHTFSAASSEQARRQATRLGVFLANEWQFGNTGLLVQLGYYVNPNNNPTPFPVYNKLGLRYYLRPIVRSGVQFYGGVYLKSHIITADYISIGIGIRFLQFS
ncbi:MAG: acyloxyacyl hydrolase [Saprospirales bacterium]|nr:acyloxyacyl hydrolase [Saprospirales bacterium]